MLGLGDDTDDLLSPLWSDGPRLRCTSDIHLGPLANLHILSPRPAVARPAVAAHRGQPVPQARPPRGAPTPHQRPPSRAGPPPFPSTRPRSTTHAPRTLPPRIPRPATAAPLARNPPPNPSTLRRSQPPEYTEKCWAELQRINFELEGLRSRINDEPSLPYTAHRFRLSLDSLRSELRQVSSRASDVRARKDELSADLKTVEDAYVVWANHQYIQHLPDEYDSGENLLFYS